MKNIHIILSDKELTRMACELAEEMGIPLSDEPDSFYDKPVFPELKEEAE